MKTLILYYSFTNNNELLAKYLGQKLNCSIARIETIKKRNGFSILLDLMFKRKPTLRPIQYNVRDFEHIVFVGPVWAGKIATPLRTFIADEKFNIPDYSFVTVCGGVNGQKEKIIQDLDSIVRKAPVDVLELWISDIVKQESKKGIKKDASGYKIDESDLRFFDAAVMSFINELQPGAAVAVTTR